MNTKTGLWAILAVLVLIGVYALYRNGPPVRSGAGKPVEYRNPVFEPVLADPSVIRGKDGFFYAYGTEDDWGDGKGPRPVPVLKSKDLVHWDVIGSAFAERPKWHDYGGGIWAPDISFLNGKYYLYYSMSVWGDSDPGIGVALSDKPEGPFEDHGSLLRSSEVGVANSIDPMLFVEDDGKPYLFWGSFHGIYGIELAKDGLSTVGEKFRIAGDEFEAPYIIKRNGKYVFFGSRGTCCEGERSGYSVSAGIAASLKGPYLDKDGGNLLSSPGTLLLTGHFPNQNPVKRIAGPGHNAVITDDKGTDWIVYHGVDVENPLLDDGATRRPLFIDPIVWVDGWPTVKDLVPGTGPLKGPVWKPHK